MWNIVFDNMHKQSLHQIAFVMQGVRSSCVVHVSSFFLHFHVLLSYCSLLSTLDLSFCTTVLDDYPTLYVCFLLNTLQFVMLFVEHSTICVCYLNTLPFVYAACWTLYHVCILLVEHSTICVCSLLNTIICVYSLLKLHYSCMLYIHHSAILDDSRIFFLQWTW